jgi:hypothetical protein
MSMTYVEFKETSGKYRSFNEARLLYFPTMILRSKGIEKNQVSSSYDK